MKVILKEDIPSFGKAGDVVDAARGYARNFLIPRKKAVEATEKNIKILEIERKNLEFKLKREKVKAQKIVERLQDIVCTIEQKVGEGDRIYGAVTSKDVAEKLDSQGISIDKRNIHLPEPIRQLGDFVAIIKLHPEVTTNIPIKVIKA